VFRQGATQPFTAPDTLCTTNYGEHRERLNPTDGAGLDATQTQLYKWYNALRRSLTKASRINAVTQVIQYMNSGMTLVEACREVGMPRSSFYYIIEHNPRAIADIQAIIDISNREQLALILQH
jgi:transposase-like protein